MTTVSTGTPGPIGADDKELAPGTEVGEYRIEAIIGKGGFGTVYGAVQPVIGKRVAIKVLARRYAADADIVSRFVAEARAVNQIRHRNIIDIFSFGQLADGRHYYVMEYLDGEPLDSYLRTRGAMSLDDALPILRAIARALDAAHAKGIAHRDLKPENIFLAHDADGVTFPKLLDFGIAKLMAPEDEVMHRTGTGVPIGTPYYMSPEQCRGRDVDHRTDIYSFGIVTYRLLTGTFPFEGDDYMELLFKQVNEEPRLPSSIVPSLPASVDHAIAWMMQKDRDRRPPSVLEGVNALDPNASTTPAPPPRTTTPPTARAVPVSKTEIELAETGVSSPNALAATSAAGATLTDPRGKLPTARRSGSGILLIGALLVLGAGGATAYYLVSRGEPERAPTTKAVASPPIATPDAAPVAVAHDAPAHPDRVMITIAGAPKGSAVLVAGRPVGVAPSVQLEYATNEVLLVVQADGYKLTQASVVPDEDKTVTVTMTKTVKRHATATPADPDSVESPFGK